MSRPRLKDPITGKDKYDPEELAKKINEYAEKAKPYPTIVEFLYENKLSKSRLHEIAKENKILSDAIEFLHYKKEFTIEHSVALGKINPNFAIFTLKQPIHGWTDKPNKEPETIPTININIPSLSNGQNME